MPRKASKTGHCAGGFKEHVTVIRGNTLNRYILSFDLDNGESEKALRFKHQRGRAKHKIHHQDNTGALVST